MQVRYNCRYALWQAQLHHPGTYIWIDAICIDQHHDAEKSAQVGRMAKLYAQANSVLVCVGRSIDGLEPFDAGILDDGKDWEVIRKLYHFEGVAPEELELMALGVRRSWQSKPWHRSFLHLDMLKATTAVPEVVRETYQSLLDRSYFERLWICQEFVSARRREILHGHRRLTAHRVDRILHLLRAPSSISRAK